MTTPPDDRVQALIACGLAERHARFLALVLVHAGVCLRRQYSAHEGVRRGRTAHAFLAALCARGWASAYPAHRRAHIYHVHGKPLYRAIGEPDSRLRKPTTLGRAIERLMLLDAVLGEPQLRWLGSAREKTTYFAAKTGMRPEELPRLRFGDGPAKTTRAFPDRLPIGLAPDGRTYVFLYCVTREHPPELRAFLHRHQALLRALPEWELRLVLPRHLAQAVTRCKRVAQEELTRPLRLDAIWELHAYFEARRRVEYGATPADPVAYERQRREYRAPRFFALYRSWLQEGDAILEAQASSALADAVDRDRGRITSVVLPYPYQHLEQVAGTA
ncbi:MAG: hypothetical protein AB7U83_04980 [Vicinamibacterales bacterium]